MADATYFFGVLSTAGANKRHLAVLNPAGSGKVMTLFRLKASGAPTAAVTGQTIALTAGRITALTGGTAVTAQRAANGDPQAHGLTAVAAPTAATEDAGFFGCGTVSGEETSSANESMVYDAEIDGSKPMTFQPGEGFLVKQGALASAGAVNIVARVGVT